MTVGISLRLSAAPWGQNVGSNSNRVIFRAIGNIFCPRRVSLKKDPAAPLSKTVGPISRLNVLPPQGPLSRDPAETKLEVKSKKYN